MAKTLSKANFDKEVLEAKKPVLVDFFAGWCGPCQMMEPVIDEIDKEVKNKAQVFKVDVEASPDLANEYQVTSIPTIFIFKDGKIFNQHNSVVSKEELLKDLK